MCAHGFLFPLLVVDKLPVTAFMIIRSAWREHDHRASKQVSKIASKPTSQWTIVTFLSVSAVARRWNLKRRWEGQMLGDKLHVKKS